MKKCLFFCVAWTLFVSFLSCAQAETLQPGTYTFDAQGYGGEATITPAVGAQGVYLFTADTFKETNGNMCSYSGTCITQGSSLLCTNPDMPEAMVTVKMVAEGIEVTGEHVGYFCGNAVFFTGAYKKADNKNTLEVEVLEFINFEEEPGYCGTLYSNNLDDYGCLFFKSKDISQKDVHMWYNYASPARPTKRADLLVAYMTSSQGNMYLASIANPRPDSVYTDEVVFLGEDTHAPDGGALMFQNAMGETLNLTCWEEFCSDLLYNQGKRMEISYQRQYYYHAGGEAFTEDSFVLGYTMLP